PTARQARLLDDPRVVDAVPEAGRVRVVLGGEPGAVPGLPRPSPVPPRFEDGFMVLLRRAAEPHAPGPAVSSQPPDRPGDEAVVEVRDLVRKFGSFTAVDHVS